MNQNIYWKMFTIDISGVNMIELQKKTNKTYQDCRNHIKKHNIDELPFVIIPECFKTFGDIENHLENCFKLECNVN